MRKSWSGHSPIKFFCLFLFEGTFISFFKDKNYKRSRNQGFAYHFCLIVMIEGSGSGSVPLTNGSGSSRIRITDSCIQRKGWILTRDHIVWKNYGPIHCAPLIKVLRIWIRNPVPFWPREPGVGKKSVEPNPGWTNPDYTYIRELRNNFLRLKYLNSLMRLRDPGMKKNQDPGMKKNQDPGWKKFGSDDRDKHPGSARLSNYTVFIILHV